MLFACGSMYSTSGHASTLSTFSRRIGLKYPLLSPSPLRLCLDGQKQVPTRKVLWALLPVCKASVSECPLLTSVICALSYGTKHALSSISPLLWR